MPLVRDADAPTHSAHGFTFRSRATPSLGSAQVALWSVEAPAGACSPRHSTTVDEVFVVQRGHVALLLDGGEVGLGPGDTYTVPAGTPFALSNPGGEPAHLLACTTAGIEALVGGQRLSPPWAA